MRASLAIGDFSRATYLSVKTLRHYHHIGLLEPVDVDAATGYRRYTTQQIPIAQVIRRFRPLDMPLDESTAVIAAPDVARRNALIAAHLSRLEGNLARTQEAVASLRNLLQAPSPAAPLDIRHRRVEVTNAAAIREITDVENILAWYHGALGELYATLAAQRLPGLAPPAASTPTTCSRSSAAKRRSSYRVRVRCEQSAGQAAGRAERRAGDHCAQRSAHGYRSRVWVARQLRHRACARS